MFSASRFLYRTKPYSSVIILNKVDRVASYHVDYRQRIQAEGRGTRVLFNRSVMLKGRQFRFASTCPDTVIESVEKLHMSQASDPSTVGPSTGGPSIGGPIEPAPIVEAVKATESSPLLSTEAIPEPPAPLVEEIVELVGGEASFASIGLGGWGPVGMIQNCFEFLHISCSLPWWTSIVIGTIVVRTLMFPLVVIAQRNAAKMNNYLPQMQVLQLKMSDARERGDRLDSARYAQEMMVFMKEKGLNPLKNMIVPLAQAPLFISFFMGLREMSNLPVASMREGGILWFTDLTVPDQFYLLPIITSATLALTIEVGTDAARLNSANMGMMKYVLRALPICIFPFTMNFSAGILVYWASTNFISLCQVAFLRIPKVRQHFKIEPLINHDKNKLPVKDKGFVKGVSESWTNLKLTRELEERQRIDEMNFMRAGRGAVKKTYKTNPTVTRPPMITIQAKKRD